MTSEAELASDPRARWLLRGIIVCVVIAAIAVVVAISLFKVRAEQRVRGRVEALLNSTNWDSTLPAVGNWSNNQEQLKENAAVIVPVLREDLTFDPDTHGRWRSLLKILARVRASTHLESPEFTRAHAAHELVRLGPAARAAVPELISRAEDSDRSVRQEVVVALAAIREDTPAVRGALGLLLTNYNLPYAQVALWCLDPSDKDALHAISLLDPIAVTRFGHIFRTMGSTAPPIAPLLRKALERPEQERGALSSYDSRLNAVRTHWLITGETDLALECVKERIELAHNSRTNSLDIALPGRSLTHLASLTIQLGEISEVRLELRAFLKDFEPQTATAKTQLKFIADELDRIEKWQKLK